jgi:putative PIN family toxin of toxin-antitoxin system
LNELGSDPLFSRVFPRAVVLDTNIVLDLFVVADEAARPVRAGLEGGGLRWLATQAMRDELERVLAYAQIVPRLTCYGLAAADVLGTFDRHSQRVEVPAKAPVTCRDPDDQKFIDLAVAHGATLLSKDRAVLALKKRLVGLAVHAGPTLPP